MVGHKAQQDRTVKLAQLAHRGRLAQLVRLAQRVLVFQMGILLPLSQLSLRRQMPTQFIS
jgi:hypothetical protein